MKTILAFPTVLVAALVLVMVHAGPTYAQHTSIAVANAGAAVDSVVGTGGHVPAQLVRGGHGRGFRFGHRRPFFFGGIGVVPYSYYGDDYFYGCGEGCYQEGAKTCVWNGYKYRCYVEPSY